MGFNHLRLGNIKTQAYRTSNFFRLFCRTLRVGFSNSEVAILYVFWTIAP
jgi:hypothetical protein